LRKPNRFVVCNEIKPWLIECYDVVPRPAPLGFQ
jgi:hypothetical protein